MSKSDFLINGDQIEIPSSKVKIALTFLGSLVFVVIGVFFIANPSFQQGARYPGWAILGLGIITVAFFGFAGFVAGRQFFMDAPGLIVNSSGIVFNPGLSNSMVIDWSGIESFGITSIRSTKIILIFLKDPETFIDGQNNIAKRNLAAFSNKTYGTPASISTGMLKCNTAELYNLLKDNLESSRKS